MCGEATGEPPDIRSLAALAAAERSCTRCPLYRNATQAVPGEGPPSARLMLVGEQPGDQEDLQGRPFVGPAGRVLDRALRDAGIDRDDAFITNAVKHFKHERRGRRRLHKRPSADEIDACRWWLDLERKLVAPDVVVALGATALRGLLHRTVAVTPLRGRPQRLPDGLPLVVTTHPSALLRIRDPGDRAAQYRAFVGDLAVAARLLSGS